MKKYSKGFKGFGKKRHNEFSGFKAYRPKRSKFRAIIPLLILTVLVYGVWHGDIFSMNGLQQTSAYIGNEVTYAVNSMTDFTKDKLASNDKQLSLPVSNGVVVEDYGVVKDELGKEFYHNGVDIKVPKDSDILAANSGEVSGIVEKEDKTFWVTITHEGNWKTVYGRLGKVNVKLGDKVEEGTVLGKPNSEILHFEVIEKSKNKNPVNYFE